MNFGRYRVEQKLGEGPRGEVYRASDAESSRGLPGVRTPQGTVALKVLHANLSLDPRLEKQCLDLVHALRLLPHGELVRLLGAGRLPEGRLYLVSEYVQGQSLATLLEEHRPLPVPQAMHITQALAAVLAGAHQKGMFHMALKPSNVMLVTDPTRPGGPRIKLLDLGVARLVPPAIEERLVPRYLAPEQVATQPGPPAPPGTRPLTIGSPADVYALGVLLYEMLTGRPLEHRGRLSGAAASSPGLRGATAPPIPLAQLVPVLPKDLLALNQAMLAREPNARPLMGEVASKLAQIEEDLLIGHDIGSYHVIERLATGGMGTVFRAENKQIGRPAAIKVMRPHFAQNPDVAKRFLNEARAVNLIRHPSLVEIYDFGELENGRPYLIMEFLQGQSLAQRRQERGPTLPEGMAVDLMRQVALVVAAIHEKGIIHRDLKPDNVMVIRDPIAPGGERIKLLDFGIAKVSAAPGDNNDSTQVNTHAGSLVGTPNYMAPEQFSGAGAVTEKTDVYALGVMLYELLAGRRPYEQPGLVQMSEPPPPLSRVAPGVSPVTAALVGRMLSFRPADRPTMAEAARELVVPGWGLAGLDEGDAATAATEVASPPVHDVGEEATTRHAVQPPPVPGLSRTTPLEVAWPVVQPPAPADAEARGTGERGRVPLPSRPVTPDDLRAVPPLAGRPSAGDAAKVPGRTPTSELVRLGRPPGPPEAARPGRRSHGDTGELARIVAGPAGAEPSRPPLQATRSPGEGQRPAPVTTGERPRVETPAAQRPRTGEQPPIAPAEAPVAEEPGSWRRPPSANAGHPWLAFVGGAVVALLGVGLYKTRPTATPGGAAVTAASGAGDAVTRGRDKNLPVEPGRTGATSGQTPHATPVAATSPTAAPGGPVASPVAAPVAPVAPVDRTALKAEALAALRAGLRDPEAAVRRQAVVLVGRLGGAAAPLRLADDLVALLSDASPRVQEEAALVLGRLGHAAAVPTLAVLVEKTGDAQTFLAAADALERLRDPRGLKRLREGLQARPLDVRARAAALLAERGDAEARQVLSKVAAASTAGLPTALRVMVLGEAGGDALSRLLEPSTPRDLRLAAAERLASKGAAAGKAEATALLTQLAGRPGGEQVPAARALALAGNNAGCPTLLAALRAPTPATGPNARAQPLVQALEGVGACATGTDAELAPLAELTKGKTSALVRVAAAGAALAVLSR